MLLSRSNCDDQYLNRNYIQSSSTQRLMPTNEHYPFPTSSWDANSSQRPTAHGDVYPFYPRPSAAGVTEAPSRQGIPTQQGGYYSYGVPGTAMSHDAGINASPQLGHAQHPSQTAATSLSRAPSRTGSAAGSSILQHISNSTEASPVLTRGVTALPINECVDPVTDPTVNEDEGDSDGSEMISESGQRLVSGQSDSTLSRKKMKRFRYNCFVVLALVVELLMTNSDSRLTHSQSRFLTAEFAKQPHPDAAHREYLSTKIPGLSPRQVQVWFQNRYVMTAPRRNILLATTLILMEYLCRRAKMKRHTQSDRDRILQMRAVPEGFDTVQALQSPYGAVSQPMASSRTPTFPTHHHPQIRTPLVELQPGSPMMLNELSAQGFRSDTMQYAADGTVHSPIAGDQGLHPLRTRRDDRSTISSPSYFPPVMPTSVPQDAQSVQQNFNYWPNPLWPESQSPSDEQRSTSHADARPPWNPSMEYQGRKPPVGQSDPAASNISGAAGMSFLTDLGS